MADVLCRKCGTIIDFATQARFGSLAGGWEHMEGECVVPRAPEPPSMGTVFRRRLEALRMELAIRCETCMFFDTSDGGRCRLKMEWTTRGDWCGSWQEIGA